MEDERSVIPLPEAARATDPLQGGRDLAFESGKLLFKRVGRQAVPLHGVEVAFLGDVDRVGGEGLPGLSVDHEQLRLLAVVREAPQVALGQVVVAPRCHAGREMGSRPSLWEGLGLASVAIWTCC